MNIESANAVTNSVSSILSCHNVGETAMPEASSGQALSPLPEDFQAVLQQEDDTWAAMNPMATADAVLATEQAYSDPLPEDSVSRGEQPHRIVAAMADNLSVTVAPKAASLAAAPAKGSSTESVLPLPATVVSPNDSQQPIDQSAPDPVNLVLSQQGMETTSVRSHEQPLSFIQKTVANRDTVVVDPPPSPETGQASAGPTARLHGSGGQPVITSERQPAAELTGSEARSAPPLSEPAMALTVPGSTGGGSNITNPSIPAGVYGDAAASDTTVSVPGQEPGFTLTGGHHHARAVARLPQLGTVQVVMTRHNHEVAVQLQASESAIAALDACSTTLHQLISNSLHSMVLSDSSRGRETGDGADTAPALKVALSLASEDPSQSNGHHHRGGGEQPHVYNAAEATGQPETSTRVQLSRLSSPGQGVAALIDLHI